MLFRYVLLLVLLVPLARPGAAQKSARPRLSGRAFACTIKPIATTYYAGQPILFRVNIQNQADSALTLVYALDGSDVLFRSPEVYFVARQLAPGPSSGGGMRCGNIGALDSTDFIRLAPGAGFDPLAKQAQYPSLISELYPTLPPGDYEITFHYSTLEMRPGNWLGTDNYTDDNSGPGWEARQEKRRAALGRQLGQVPRVHLVSNPVRVWVRPARSTSAQLDGE